MSPAEADISLFAAVLRHQPSCIVHIVETVYSPNYTNVLVPFILSKLCPHRECSKTETEVIKSRSAKRPTLKNLFCFVGALLLSETHYEHYADQQWLSRLDQLMSHSYILGLPYPHNINIMTASQYFFIFDNVLHVTSDTVATGALVEALISLRYVHLPPIFVIRCVTSGVATVTNRWFVCHYCGGKEFYEFECTEETACVHRMWEKYRIAIDDGKSVAWVINRLPIKSIVRTFEKQKYCPMTLKRKTTNCYSRRLELTAGVVFAELNTTAVNKPSELEIFATEMPSLYTTETLGGNNQELVLTGHSSSFLFITTDSVVKSGRSLFGYLTNAFDLRVWYVISLAVAAIATILTYYETAQMSHLSAFLLKIIQTSAVLLDQAYFPDRATHHRNVSRRAFVATWLMSALVLSVSYKCMFKCHQIFEPQYETKWKDLVEISNFSIYFGIHKENDDGHLSCERTYFRSCDGTDLVRRCSRWHGG